MKITKIPQFTGVRVLYRGTLYTKENAEYSIFSPQDIRFLLISDDPNPVLKGFSNIAEVVFVPNFENLLTGAIMDIETFVDVLFKQYCHSDARVELIG